MGKTCLGCGKAIGGVIGAYSVKLLYGEVCLTCNKKLNSVPNHNFLTPPQIRDIISGRVQKEDVKVSSSFVHPGDAAPQEQQLSPADEVRRYKGLLDDEIITEEEFHEVKRHLMETPVDVIRQYKELLDSDIITEDEFIAVKRRLMDI
ncbi:MAG: SHOCT domain-containing protein [Methanomassiliicoccaceae archaeon]|nr:SHOCT domain-containing protein [Methanomassiliicoccaceae archaeon]